jgi:hypothetical protein
LLFADGGLMNGDRFNLAATTGGVTLQNAIVELVAPA